MKMNAMVVVALLTSVVASVQPARADDKSPVVAGVLSWVVPGVGQMYDGQVGTGLAFTGGVLALYAGALVSAAQTSVAADGTVSSPGAGRAALFLVTAIGVQVWDIVNAVSSANDYNKGHASGTKLAAARRFSLQISSLLGPPKASAGWHMGVGLATPASATVARCSYTLRF